MNLKLNQIIEYEEGKIKIFFVEITNIRAEDLPLSIATRNRIIACNFLLRINKEN